MIGEIFQPCRVWVVLTFGDDRQYAGNSGYADDPGKRYLYDSFVANHRQLKAGDCAIVCDRTRALGAALIERIETEPSTRVMQRCPVCKDSAIKLRKTKDPPYRCNNGHEFADPVKETVDCTKYAADFGRTFVGFSEEVSRDFLRKGCPRYSDQLAMQEFDYTSVEALFSATYPHASATVSHFLSTAMLPPEAAASGQLTGAAEYRPDRADERERILRQICERRGQRKFRDALRGRYGDRCVISGCTVLHVLEAAHICPYRGEPDNHPENGLLLRADLHTLFDLDLIGIEPRGLIIHVHPDVTNDIYAALQQKALTFAIGREPSRDALTIRWEAFQRRAAIGKEGPAECATGC